MLPKNLIIICIFMITLYQKIDTKHTECRILMLVDDSVMGKLEHNFSALRQKLDFYMRELNQIFRSTVLSKPPHNKLFFVIRRVKYLRNFLPGCNCGDVSTSSYTFSLSLHIILNPCSASWIN